MIELIYNKGGYMLVIDGEYVVAASNVGEAKEKLLSRINYDMDKYINEHLVKSTGNLFNFLKDDTLDKKTTSIISTENRK